MTFNAKLLTATAAALIGALALTGCNESPAPAEAQSAPAAQTQQAPEQAQPAPEKAPAPDAQNAQK